LKRWGQVLEMCRSNFHTLAFAALAEILLNAGGGSIAFLPKKSGITIGLIAFFIENIACAEQVWNCSSSDCYRISVIRVSHKIH
jgi:hypothetical protein